MIIAFSFYWKKICSEKQILRVPAYFHLHFLFFKNVYLSMIYIYGAHVTSLKHFLSSFTKLQSFIHLFIFYDNFLIVSYFKPTGENSGDLERSWRERNGCQGEQSHQPI